MQTVREVGKKTNGMANVKTAFVKRSCRTKETRTGTREQEEMRKSVQVIGGREKPEKRQGCHWLIFAVAGLQLVRLVGRLVRDTPSKTSLSGCPNQSTKVTTSSNIGFTTRAAPGACPPGRTLPLLPEGAPPPVPVPDIMVSRLEGLESERMAWKVH